ncbi:hypothetical protein N7533_003300 [Penicillium manginii]|uniref:uncharacterized protein n=1 Tax=Penicillium manginii TaxID=203109 RepID=UPI00254780F0|nr:uncharacterized protein N7533_003300 [Penicillium manginii]KAJ5764619.1 hypothetical protein N7533_003300 [Penicillium manginii]
MESLADTTWDVIIAGTGLSQSLLALALSRSGKKVLHLDQNPHYGGPDAAFSLEEAHEWILAGPRLKMPRYSHTNIPQSHRARPPSQNDSEGSERMAGTPDIRPKLAASRAYTLSLSPYFLYTRSALISILISSKVYRQLEFVALGSWWIHTGVPTAESDDLAATNIFHRVPGNREDVFADNHISMKSKRTLMRFLRHISKSEDDNGSDTAEELSAPFGKYLSTKFSVPDDLLHALHSLSLSQGSAQDTLAEYAVPRVQRHLSSIGSMGPGFGGVVSKYGGASEILQVACRACAVGGGAVALAIGVQSLKEIEATAEKEEYPVELELTSGESVRSKFVIGSLWDLPSQSQPLPSARVARSITVVSSSFTSLFPITTEGAPLPASTVLMFPGDTLSHPQSPPVYLQIHSSDTGDCPRQQSVIYGSVALSGPEGHTLLECAVDRLLHAEGPQAMVLWSMRYTQSGRLSNDGSSATIHKHSPHVYSFPPSSLDLTWEDEVIDMVKQAWTKIVGDEVDHDDFMIFDDREGTSDD